MQYFIISLWGWLSPLLPASVLHHVSSPKRQRSDCRACSLFVFGPGEAVERRNGIHAGAGNWDHWVRARVPLPPIRGRNPGGLAASAGRVVLSLLIALTPGRMPTPPWPPLLGDGTSVTLRGERCPSVPGSPSLPSALPGQIHLHGEKRCPGPPAVSAAAGDPVTFLRGAGVCRRCLPAVTESSSPGTRVSFWGLSGPAQRPASPVPQPAAVPPVPRSALPGNGGTKGPSVPAGERLRLGGAPSRRGSLRPLPGGATGPGPPGALPGTPRAPGRRHGSVL